MRRIAALCGLTIIPSLALAHTGAGVTTGLIHGIMHPLGGLDHLLALVAVGLWAGQSGGVARHVLPVAFVVAMVAGGGLGVAGVALWAVKPGIAASVVVTGLLIAFALRLPPAVAVAVTVPIALLHGHAHGTEMVQGGSWAAYALGFAVASSALLTAGAWLAALPRAAAAGSRWVRGAGASVGLIGGGLLATALAGGWAPSSRPAARRRFRIAVGWPGWSWDSHRDQDAPCRCIAGTRGRCASSACSTRKASPATSTSCTRPAAW